MVKADFIGLQWFAKWSADDIAAIPAMVHRVVEDLKQQDWTPYQVAAALSDAYQAETRERAVTEILSPFGLDMPAFLSTGGPFLRRTIRRSCATSSGSIFASRF
jgi:hypothetical protein